TTPPPIPASAPTMPATTETRSTTEIDISPRAASSRRAPPGRGARLQAARDARRVRSEVALVDDAVRADDERHDARRGVLRRVRDDRNAAASRLSDEEAIAVERGLVAGAPGSREALRVGHDRVAVR